MSVKKGVYFSDEAVALLGEVTSKRVATALDRYSEILRRERVERLFTEVEWNILRDVCNGTLFEPARLIPGALAAEVDDYLADDPREVVDVGELREKLQDLNYVQQIAIIESVEQWWREQSK